MVLGGVLRRSTAWTQERCAVVGMTAAAALAVAAFVLPVLLGWQVHAQGVPPLHAHWQPRLGPGSVPALLLAGAGVWAGPRLAGVLRWNRLLMLVFTSAVAWMVALATVDGWAGLGRVLASPSEYLPSARQVDDISAFLHEYVQRIPFDSAHNWPTHLAGHPPGAALFFVALDRLGLHTWFTVGWVVVLVAATIPVAVLATLRRLGAELAARDVAPLLVLGPFAIWQAVSADAVFAAVTAWGLCALSVAATQRQTVGTAGWGVLAGLLLGCGMLMSYGLALIVVLALGVLLAARTARPVLWALGGFVLVPLAFAVAGFSLWQALPVLRVRYYAGIGGLRPAGYWIWADLAVLTISAGPAVGAAMGVAARAVTARVAGRSSGAARRPVLVLGLAAAVSVLLADASLMSKAEVERIWLPFVPWLLLPAALLSPRTRRWVLVLQVAVALAVQTMLNTQW